MTQIEHNLSIIKQLRRLRRIALCRGSVAVTPTQLTRVTRLNDLEIKRSTIAVLLLCTVQ